MILQEQVLALLKQELDTLGYDNYCYLGPDEATYPFVTYSPVSSAMDEGFTKDYENIRVQISVFDDSPSPSKLIGMLNVIEHHFHRNHSLTLPDSEAGVLNCIKKTNEFLRRDNDDFYWQGIIEFLFLCQKNPTAIAESSSSSSSSSSSA